MGVVDIPWTSDAAVLTSTIKSAASRKYHNGDLRQALISAGVAIVTEEQNWSFSLREVAPRAGVSHNAPYNHFAEKRDLLAANNPALYRLMFGPELAEPDGARPELAETSGAGAKAVLRDVVIRGAEEGIFNASADNETSIAMSVLAAMVDCPRPCDADCRQQIGCSGEPRSACRRRDDAFSPRRRRR